MTDDKMICARLSEDKAQAFAESVREDEEFTNQSDALRYLIDRWLAYDIW